MSAKVILEIENNGIIQKIETEKALTIGRETKNSSADIPLMGDYISRLHGIFEPDERGCTYTDKNSTNGTWLNGVPLIAGEPVSLHNGDVLQLAGGDLRSAAEVTTIYYIVPSETIMTRTVADPEAFGSLGGFDELDELPVILIEEPKHEEAVKKEPEQVRKMPEPVRKTPEPVPAEVRKTPAAESSDAARSTYAGGDSLDIDIRKRTVSSRSGTISLLRDVSMEIPAGSMVLILGGSGAGKTTFMNAVMGYEKADATIMYGSKDIYEEFDTMKFEIGYVPQQDLMRGSDSVYETLRNAAEMKLPLSYGGAKREARIEYVLEMLGLGREKATAVSRLSGGQRKRLSIALEYVSNPALFFLDEPDSGLDGVMARSLMNSLRAIADEGKIIMVISHGPDRARELFDRVIVLAKSEEDNCGRLAFYGTVDEALAFFEVSDLEGVVMRINREDEGGEGKADFYINKYTDYKKERQSR